MLAMVFYGLASMHCTLEGVPGLGFLKTCCFLDRDTPPSQDCDSDGCGPIEGSKYFSEHRTVSAPQPFLFIAVLSLVLEASPPDAQVASFVPSESPPELPKAWQFQHRTALPPRAPSVAS